MTAACSNLCKKTGLAHRFVQPEKPCHSLQNQIFITTDAAHGGQGTVGGVCDDLVTLFSFAIVMWSHMLQLGKHL